MIKSIKYLLFFALLAAGCNSKNELQQSGLHYQQYQDYKSLENVVKLLPADVDTGAGKNIFGTPNDMGFEYRYTVDSTGENGCTIGAVFQINEKGKIIQKWINEICE